MNEWHRLFQQLSPEERLGRGFDLSEFARVLAEIGLRRRHPHLSDDEFRREFVRWLYGESVAELIDDQPG